jgi:cell wall-associated NlpC family hydrolase
MSRPRGGTLTRVVMSAAIAIGAVATLMAAPAGAVGRQDDMLSEAAFQTLLDLDAVQAHRAAIALGTEPSGSPAASTAEGLYAGDLGIVANLVSPRTASTPDAFVAAWTAAGEARMTVLLSALAEVGVPYHRNSAASGAGFDCSGLTMYAWAQVGVSLAHQDRAQIAQSAPRSWDTALAGDLVQYPGHVMMYVGAGHAIVDAPHTGAWVRVKEYSGGRGVNLGSPLG